LFLCRGDSSSFLATFTAPVCMKIYQLHPVLFVVLITPGWNSPCLRNITSFDKMRSR
jgi:hypothetical protein